MINVKEMFFAEISNFNSLFSAAI